MASSSSSSSSQQHQHKAQQEERASEEALIPGLPDDLSGDLILSLLPLSLLPSLRGTSRLWRSLLSSDDILLRRRRRGHLLCVFPGDPHLLPRPHLLDPLTNLWHPLPPLPPDPHSHSLSHFHPIPVGHILFLLGGSRFDARSFPLHLPSPSPSAFRLRLAPRGADGGPSWAPLLDMPTPRGSFACAATLDGRRILVVGGGSRHVVFPCGGTRTDAVEVLDVETGEWTAAEPLRTGRAGCVGWVMMGDEEEEFWVMGGYSGYRTVSGVFPEDVHCRDGEVLGLRTGTWRAIGDMWEEGERRKLGKVAVLVDQETTAVFMLDNNHIFRYNVASNRWFKETTLRRKLVGDESCGFVAMNGELYILTSLSSGYLADPRKLLKKKATLNMQIYDPKKRKWRFITTSTPFKQPLDFRIAVLCTIQL